MRRPWPQFGQRPRSARISAVPRPGRSCVVRGGAMTISWDGAPEWMGQKMRFRRSGDKDVPCARLPHQVATVLSERNAKPTLLCDSGVVTKRGLA